MLNDILKNINNIKDFYNIIDKINNIDILDDKKDWILNKRILCKNFLLKVLYERKKTLKIQDNPKFNLQLFLSKKLIRDNRLIDILEKYPNINRNIGKIPKVFFKNIPRDKHKEYALKIYELFSNYSLILNYDFSLEPNNEDYWPCKDGELAQKLSKLLKQKISINYVGHGCNGNGFKINIDNKNYFYKVFYLYNTDENIFDQHGINAEVPFAYYANKKGRIGQFAKFYFGRIASKHEKDCFLITEFIDKKQCNTKKNKLSIDYLTINADEKRKISNSINDKIVDFGGLIESNIQELKNAEIRKFIRIILKHINYKFDDSIFEATWEINENNLNSLKKYVNKKGNYNSYQESINIIQTQIHNIPPEIIDLLKNINSNTKPIKIIDTLLPKHLFTNNLNSLLNNIKHYNIKIKTSQNAQINSLGYIILDLNNNKICVCRYNTNNEIQEIRIEEISNGKINQLIKLTQTEILQCPIKDFKNLL